ncbi:hypothetical protein Rs2_46338 [Raphanus sativus]|nr:hypothetical protein Rs2_46338 [Raphanus sativus]
MNLTIKRRYRDLDQRDYFLRPNTFQYYTEALSANRPDVDLCNKEFTARERPLQGLSSKDSTLKGVLSQILRETQQRHPVAPSSSVQAFGQRVETVGVDIVFLGCISTNGSFVRVARRKPLQWKSFRVQVVGEKRKREEFAVDLKFNDFDKLRKKQLCSWTRITYLEPDPDDENEIHGLNRTCLFLLTVHYSHMLPTSTKEEATTLVISLFIQGRETWALFKNWDINWSSEPDSHRKYEYEFVQILQIIALMELQKALQASSFVWEPVIPTSFACYLTVCTDSPIGSLPSKLTGVDVKGLPKYAYELDQAALPATIEEVTSLHIY